MANGRKALLIGGISFLAVIVTVLACLGSGAKAVSGVRLAAFDFGSSGGTTTTTSPVSGSTPDTTTTTSTPTTPTTPTGSCAVSSNSDFGFATSSAIRGYSPSDLTKTMTALKDLGAGWLRVSVDWSAVEQTKGVRNWSAYDNIVNAARAQGISVLGILQETPAWARLSTASSSQHSWPANNTDFANYAAAAASHFSGRITNWEIWNEPNLAVFAQPAPSVATYGALIQAASSAIRTAEPGATIITGGLSPAVDNGTDISPVTFLTQLYALGIKNSWDAVAMHPYSYPALPNQAGTDSWNSFIRMNLMRTTMVNNGDSEKKIWLTEFGAPTGTGTDAVSTAQQSAILTTGISLERASTWMGPIFIYNERDTGTDVTDREQNFGVMSYNFSPKPAYSAVRNLVRNCT